MTETRDPYDPPLRGGRTPWRRNWGLGFVVIAGFVVGTPITRLLETYRGVVLSREGDKMFMGFESKPPKLYDAIEGAQPGNIITKERGSWSAVIGDPLGRDIKLMQMQKRYVSEYDATITRIDKPLSAQQAAVAVAQTADGTVLRVPLFADELAGSAVGRHLKKFANSWDPILVDDSTPTANVPSAPPAPGAATPKSGQDSESKIDGGATPTSTAGVPSKSAEPIAPPEAREPPAPVKPAAPPVPIVPPTKS